jgi:2-amino-4-hydroxy-6-hydroxymethyldihydropteridine diphosphokinase
VVEVQTVLKPLALLAALQVLESRAGRQRSYRNAPRTLDLDILLYGNKQINSATLVLPHPRMWERAFVLLPLAEIIPDRVTPAQLEAVADQAVWRHPCPT